MRLSMEEPTGMRVRDEAGREVTLTFAVFADAVERGLIGPDDHVRSHIVTADQWVRVGDLRLYRVLMEGGRARRASEREALEAVWPPPPPSHQP